MRFRLRFILRLLGSACFRRSPIRARLCSGGDRKACITTLDGKLILRPGGEWRSDGVSDVDGKPYHVGGEYVEIDPPRMVSFTWVASWSGPVKTLVRWDLEESGEGTTARLRHSGFGALGGEHAKNHYQGWIRVIAWMQAFVERGETVETRPQIAKTPAS